jgi:PAS domain S-box-containing protein
MTSGARSDASATRELRETEERFKLLVESVVDYAIFLLDPVGTIISWNVGASRIKGYTADEVIGRNFAIFYPPEDMHKPPAELREAAAQGRLEDEGWRVRKNGERFWANVIITPLYDERGLPRGFAKVTRDLTERRQKEEAERRAALHAEASRLKDEFLAMVSHELRTPLNVVLGQTALLQRETLPAEQARRGWAALERNLALLTQIIDDLLDLSRITTGKFTLERNPVDLRPLIEQAVEEATPAAEAKGLEIRRRVDATQAVVLGDEGRLHQVINNLLSNAVKFTPAGGWVDVECGTAGRSVLVRISDSGIGMEPEFLGSVFDRFSQADTSIRREHAGLGLGLAITRELVARHGGTITAASAGKGKGSTFEVRLPLMK